MTWIILNWFLVINLWFFKKRKFRDFEIFDFRFIPVFSEKKKFFDFFDCLKSEEKKEFENNRLDLLFDTFPTKLEEMGPTGGYWMKYENDKRTYYFFKKRPDYVDMELFFNIMNGITPDPIKTKCEYLEDDGDVKNIEDVKDEGKK